MYTITLLKRQYTFIKYGLPLAGTPSAKDVLHLSFVDRMKHDVRLGAIFNNEYQYQVIITDNLTCMH